MRRFGVEPNNIGTVFISHVHGDHFCRVAFLFLDAQFYSRRTAPLTLVCPPKFRERLCQTMELFFPGSSTVRRPPMTWLFGQFLVGYDSLSRPSGSKPFFEG